MGHEMHEINALEKIFAETPDGSMSFKYFRSLVDTDFNGKLHLQALRVSNELIEKVRTNSK